MHRRKLPIGIQTFREIREDDDRIGEILEDNARRLGVKANAPTLPGRIARLIHEAAALTGQRAVVLVDEYDKPILDNPIGIEFSREQRTLTGFEVETLAPGMG